MKPLAKVIFLIILALGMNSCGLTVDKNQFSSEGIKNQAIDPTGQKSTVQQILNERKGKVLVLDLWASWCGDCIKGLPVTKERMKKYKEKNVEFIFFSVDENEAQWRAAIDYFKIDGNHYLLKGGWDNSFSKSVRMKWIPRYMVVNQQGGISLFKATRANDPNIEKAIDLLLK